MTKPASSWASAPDGFGWFGKVPAAGDFVHRRLPESFRTAWDEWVSAGMLQAAEKYGEGWPSVFLSFPVWRYLWKPGEGDSPTWLGVLLPGVDRVGRLFPLTISRMVSSERLMDCVLRDLEAQLDEVERHALRMLEDDDLEAFDAALRGLEFAPPEDEASGNGLARQIEREWLRQWIGRGPSTVFWNRDPTSPTLLVLEACPPRPERFVCLIDPGGEVLRATPSEEPIP